MDYYNEKRYENPLNEMDYEYKMEIKTDEKNKNPCSFFIEYKDNNFISSCSSDNNEFERRFYGMISYKEFWMKLEKKLKTKFDVQFPLCNVCPTCFKNNNSSTAFTHIIYIQDVVNLISDIDANDKEKINLFYCSMVKVILGCNHYSFIKLSTLFREQYDQKNCLIFNNYVLKNDIKYSESHIFKYPFELEIRCNHCSKNTQITHFCVNKQFKVNLFGKSFIKAMLNICRIEEKDCKHVFGSYTFADLIQFQHKTEKEKDLDFNLFRKTQNEQKHFLEILFFDFKNFFI